METPNENTNHRSRLKPESVNGAPQTAIANWPPQPGDLIEIKMPWGDAFDAVVRAVNDGHVSYMFAVGGKLQGSLTLCSFIKNIWRHPKS